jgi:lysophospholipase L1-like esterase
MEYKVIYRNHRCYIILFLLFFFCSIKSDYTLDKNGSVKDPDPNRFEKQIDIFSSWDKKNSYPKNSVLFVGSSSIRLWETRIFFPDYPVINRGFGGAHISDVVYFYNQLVLKYKPQIIIFYAGDNDIAYDKSTEQVIDDYKRFIQLVKTDLPDTKIIYLPIKPSLARWQFWSNMRAVNISIQEYCEDEHNLYYVDSAIPTLGIDNQPDTSLFIADSLHLNLKGYQNWSDILSPFLKDLYQE